MPSHNLCDFTFDGTNFLYGGTERVPIDELRLLLARGSGNVVREGRRYRPWFQAQCAHYGLPAKGTLATLRLQLDKFLACPAPQVPSQLVLLERRKRNEYYLTKGATDQGTKHSSIQQHSCKPSVEPSPETHSPCDRSVEQRTSESPSLLPKLQRTEPINKAKWEQPTLAAGTPKKPTIPRAKLAAVTQFQKSAAELNTLRTIKPQMGRPQPTSDTESDSDEDSYVPTQGNIRQGYRVQYVPRSLVSFTQDIVSGKWELHATSHTILPLPAPWRPVSSKLLQGDMNVCLSDDGRSLLGEFTLLGMEGMFKSRKCELRPDGIDSWMRFVAQMLVTTAKQARQQDGRRHKLVFGSSETQYGYLRFYGGGKVSGMMKCRDYGKLEFTGTRVSGPSDMVSSWKNFVE